MFLMELGRGSGIGGDGLDYIHTYLESESDSQQRAERGRFTTNSKVDSAQLVAIYRIIIALSSSLVGAACCPIVFLLERI